MNYPESVIGQHFNLPFPTSVEHFITQGENFLTAAFRASGIIAADNSVVKISNSREFFGGGMGRKLVIDIVYEKPETNLHNRLFVKFPREFGDPLRELFNPVMEPEIRFALLSRQTGFPIAVPGCYFADNDPATACNILITETINFGQGTIEPCYDKCLDYKLDEPYKHYAALVTSLATLSGSHKAGRLGDDIDQQFPPGAADAAGKIPYTAEQLSEKISKLKEFSQLYPQLIPEQLLADNFLDSFSKQAAEFLQRETDIRHYLNATRDYIALCHWNANIDNAWFWKDNHGELQAGLLDWGSVGQMNIAQAFFGLICAAETDFLTKHKDDLIELFLQQYHHHGGPLIDSNDFKYHLQLATAVLGIAWMLDAPSLIENEIDNLQAVNNRYDSAFSDNFLARAQLHLMLVFLHTWKQEDFGQLLLQLPEAAL